MDVSLVINFPSWEGVRGGFKTPHKIKRMFKKLHITFILILW